MRRVVLQLSKVKKTCEKQGKELDSCRDMIKTKDKSLEVSVPSCDPCWPSASVLLWLLVGLLVLGCSGLWRSVLGVCVCACV